jgi:hypothetical protein
VVRPARSGLCLPGIGSRAIASRLPCESHEPECRATSRTHLPHDGGPQRRDATALGRACFSGVIISGMVNRSLVTLSFEKFRAGGKMIKVRIVRITTAGRDTLAVDN